MMEDKKKQEELSRSANEHQIGSVWIGLGATFVSVVVGVISQRFSDKWETILFQVALAFMGIVVSWKLYQAHLHGTRITEAIRSQRYIPIVYFFAVFLDIIWLTGWYTILQNWLLTSTEISNALIVTTGVVIILLAVGLYFRVRTRSSAERLGKYSNEAAAEFLRLNQVTVEVDQKWQQRVKELETENDKRVKKIESERDVYKDWWLRLSQGTLRLMGLSESKLEKLENDPLMLTEYSFRTVKHLERNAVRKVVYYDTNYLSSFVTNLEKARDFFTDRGFVVKNASELRKWMRDAIDNAIADKCIAVFIQDVIPDTVAEELDKSCTLRQFLEKGGRVVWRGDVPCYYLGRADKVRGRWTENGAWEILGVSYENLRVSDPQARHGRLWDNDFGVLVTGAGKDIGITVASPARRPVPRQDVTVVYAEIDKRIALDPSYPAQRANLDGYFACCWKKNFNSAYPHSGFMQYYLGEWNGDSEQELETFLKFSLAGWPLPTSSTRYLLM